MVIHMKAEKEKKVKKVKEPKVKKVKEPKVKKVKEPKKPKAAKASGNKKTGSIMTTLMVIAVVPVLLMIVLGVVSYSTASKAILSKCEDCLLYTSPSPRD